jgi:lipopolysaccharide export system protein LptC
MSPDGKPGRAPDGSNHEANSEVMWQPRDVSVAGSVQQYSRFVQRMKIGLPVAAGVILLLVFLLPQFRGESDRFRIGLKNVKGVATDTLSMMNARYFGTDDKGEPFSINAQGVRERASEDKLIDLTEPRAEMSSKDGKRVKMNASAGVYDRNHEQLDLSGQVDLFHDQGYEMHTSQARIMLKEGTASGTAPVTGKGTSGEIEASGFTAHQNDNVVHFTGPAKLVLNPKKSDPAPAVSAPASPPTASSPPASASEKSR